MEQLEDQLNAADALLGDGDTGSMLARVIEKMAATDLSAMSDIGAAFNALARAIMSATGSSLGTLLATALHALAKATKGRSEIPWPELSSLIGQAIEAMRARGGASLGDKTILDALHRVAQSLAGITDASTAGDAACAAEAGARAALEQFKPLPCKIGRARLFPEKSTGAHDPGMLALALLLEQSDLPESSAASFLKTVP
jgi:dihydroxyacetone kinase